MSDMRLIVAGAGGRMGRTLVKAIAETKGLTLAGAIDAPGSAGIGRDAGELAGLGANGVAVTAETCPHYLTFAAEDVPDGATPFKCCPPIREAANRELLWEGLRSGVVGCVVSDHSPCTPSLKRLDTGDFGAAWGGIASLQLGLPAVWTQARARGFGLADVVRWMAERPADLVGLAGKGRIAVGDPVELLAETAEV